ncbi:hypothetical protein BWZ22_06855 [Seonamhaeicola sp. S2-3]|uniref:hypothetical protein n=1 Tax=Seonamhaeicola sp. S2-3 TaxID=1936081 RepID=UPI000972BD39|nr:hypothetical protein [Seonamhaeicola sp. S2-3]APY10977.1 hypothetical protein BWZ22_06855 [Seonamhaeicola sp. S2-3]
MKKIVFTSLAIIVSVSVYAQKRNDFKGPAYKNYKPWLYDTKPTEVYSVKQEEKLTGPEYKNQKVWENSSKKSYKLIAVGTERSKLKGPAYKNYRPSKKI